MSLKNLTRAHLESTARNLELQGKSSTVERYLINQIDQSKTSRSPALYIPGFLTPFLFVVSTVTTLFAAIFLLNASFWVNILVVPAYLLINFFAFMVATIGSGRIAKGFGYFFWVAGFVAAIFWYREF